MRLNNFINEKIKNSVAIFFNNGKKFLAVKATNLNYWELPKGLVDSGENIEDTAIREFYEEVGIRLNKENLNKIGVFPFHPTKDIILFTYNINKLPLLSSMKCNSYTNSYGDPIPEIDDYQYIDFNDYKKIRKEFWLIIDNVIKNQKY